MSGPRLLAWDIEVSPMKVYTWSLWPKVIPIEQIIETQSVMCFAAKWLGEDKVTFRSTFHNGVDSMLSTARKLLHEADGVLSWNGKAYDTLHMNREFEQYQMERPSPYAEVDLMRAAKKSMRFASNKLDHVSRELGFAGKHKVDFELWLACERGDARAWAQMRRYNKQDVVLLEDLHGRLLPWITGHPNVALHYEQELDEHGAILKRCTACGSTNLRKEGFAYTQAGKYQRYQCRDCTKFSKDPRRVSTTALRAVA